MGCLPSQTLKASSILYLTIARPWSNNWGPLQTERRHLAPFFFSPDSRSPLCDSCITSCLSGEGVADFADYYLFFRTQHSNNSSDTNIQIFLPLKGSGLRSDKARNQLQKRSGNRGAVINTGVGDPRSTSTW